MEDKNLIEKYEKAKERINELEEKTKLLNKIQDLKNLISEEKNKDIKNYIPFTTDEDERWEKGI